MVVGHNARPGGQLHVAQAEPDGGLPILGCQQGVTIPIYAAQHSVQRIFGSLRDLQVIFRLRVFSTSQTESQPAQNPLTQTVGQAKSY